MRSSAATRFLETIASLAWPASLAALPSGASALRGPPMCDAPCRPRPGWLPRLGDFLILMSRPFHLLRHVSPAQGPILIPAGQAAMR